MKKIESCKINDVIEVAFLDHSSGNNWTPGDTIMEMEEFEVVLVGYYIGSTKNAHRFGMAYAPHNGTYGPFFSVLKKDVLRWRKRNAPRK